MNPDRSNIQFYEEIRRKEIIKATGPGLNKPFELNDIMQFGVTAVSILTVNTLSPMQWLWVADRIAAAAVALQPGRTQQAVAKLDSYFPAGLPTDRSKIHLITDIVSSHFQQNMLFARLRKEPAYRPTFTVEGLDKVSSAVKEGKGVVLWAVPQTFATILMRLIASDAGWPIYHLRHWSHGPSSTRFGRKFVNDLQWRAENMFATHIEIEPTGPTKALREAARQLRRGHVVQFHGVSMSDAPATLPLFDGHFDLALGAPRLALRNGASLFGVAAPRSHDGNGFSVKIAPLFEAGDLLSAGSRGSINQAVDKFRVLIEDTFRTSPDLWPVHYWQFRHD